MTNVEMGKAANVGFLEHAARKLAIALLSPTILRYETTDSADSIAKAEKLLKEGQGIIVTHNHFSDGEPPRTVEELFRNTVMGSKKIIAPIAYHMNAFPYRLLGKILDVTLKPIVTKNTVKEKRYKDYKLNEGTEKYFAESIELLKKGGILVLAPQGTRMSHLGQSYSPTVGTFMAGAKKNKLVSYAFLFIGFGIKGVDDYSKEGIRGLNLSREYIMNIGACLTSQEILERAKGNYREVDKIVYDELRKVVPDAYK